MKMNDELAKGAAGEINRLHSEILQAARASIDKATRIGELLTAQKAQLKHGEWLPWLEANVVFTDRTARNYIRVYQNRDQLKSETVSDLTDAYALLAKSKDEPAMAASLEDRKPFLERTRELNGILEAMRQHSTFTLKLLEIHPALLDDRRDSELGKFFEQTTSIGKELHERSATEFEQLDGLETFEILVAIDSVIELWALNQNLARQILECIRQAG